MPASIQQIVGDCKGEKLRGETSFCWQPASANKKGVPMAPASKIKSAFAARLRALRMSLPPPEGQKEMTQAAFAAMLGIADETYRRYERGETEPPLAVLARIRDVTGASLNALVAGEIDRAA